MKRLSPISYLSLHSIIGIALSCFFIWVFGEITESILSGDTFITFDQWVVRHILHFRNTYVTSFMETATYLGGISVIAPCSLIAASYLLLKRQYYTSAGLATAVTGGFILNNLLKIIFQRSRPITEYALIEVSGWSFPSGHAMNSMIFYGMMAYLISRSIRSWRLRIVVVTVSFSIAFIVGLSRIYLQVHYVSDVMAGFAGGLFWLCVCITGMEINKKRRKANDSVT